MIVCSNSDAGRVIADGEPTAVLRDAFALIAALSLLGLELPRE